MTKGEFLTKFEELAKGVKWSSPAMRCESGLCPIEFIAFKITGKKMNYIAAANALGLSEPDVTEIVRAADDYYGNSTAEIALAALRTQKRLIAASRVS